MTLDNILDSFSELPIEQQESIVEIMNKRLSDKRRNRRICKKREREL